MKVRNEVLTGTFIAGCLALLAALVFVMGQDRQIFAKQVEYYASFRDVKGLSIGAPVRFGGIIVGRVDKIAFSSDPQDKRVHVTLLVNEIFVDRIKPDSQVSLETQGLLGDRFVSISAGQEVQYLPPKSALQSVEATDFSQIIQKVQVAVDNTTSITDRINKTLEGLKPETIEKMGDFAASASRLIDDIRTKKGFIHRLIYSESEGSSLIDSLSSSADDLSGLIKDAKEQPGLIHALVYDPKGGEAISNLTKSLAQIGSASEAVAKLANKTIGEDLTNTISSFSEAATNFKIASEALAQGTGTLGALLLDPTVYDNLVEATDGAKRSIILRQAIRAARN